jgi:hypothetical protein
MPHFASRWLPAIVFHVIATSYTVTFPLSMNPFAFRCAPPQHGRKSPSKIVFLLDLSRHLHSWIQFLICLPWLSEHQCLPFAYTGRSSKKTSANFCFCAHSIRSVSFTLTVLEFGFCASTRSMRTNNQSTIDEVPTALNSIRQYRLDGLRRALCIRLTSK